MEIERKFLLKNEEWRHEAVNKVEIIQAVITKHELFHTRVRIATHFTGFIECSLTLKSNKASVERTEEVMFIPLKAAQELIDNSPHFSVKKNRYQLKGYGNHYTVDEIEGGTNLLEIEYPDLQSTKEFKIPEWAGEEVTNNPSHYFVNQ